jgi:DNA-binding response OmpR family regulator
MNVIETASSSSSKPTVLVVDDDPSTRETIRLVLRSSNMKVEEASSGSAALDTLRSRVFDLVMIDLRLPDMSGLDLVERLQDEDIRFKWLLMSGFLTLPEAVEAMRRGAHDAVTCPFDIESVVSSVFQSVRSAGRPGWRLIAEDRGPTSHSAAERWAKLVVRACSADHDLKTLRDWGAFVGVGYSSLAEACRLVGIQPHQARDFVRILRALVASRGRVKHLELSLNINDGRTLKALLRRSGLDEPVNELPSVVDFVQRQHFISPTHNALAVLLRWFEIER